MDNLSIDATGPLGVVLAADAPDTSCCVQILNARRRKKEKVFVAIIDGVFTEEECKACISATEARGYEQAMVNVGGGKQEFMPDARRHGRVMSDDPDLAAVIFARVREHLPADYRGFVLTGINERLRFLRYHPGDFFTAHTDGCYPSVDGTQKSRITLQLYLNDVTDGGATTFYDLTVEGQHHDTYPVVPRTGRVLLFSHNIRHEGSMLLSGIKYAMRTDIMYAMHKASQQ